MPDTHISRRRRDKARSIVESCIFATDDDIDGEGAFDDTTRPFGLFDNDPTKFRIFVRWLNECAKMGLKDSENLRKFSVENFIEVVYSRFLAYPAIEIIASTAPSKLEQFSGVIRDAAMGDSTRLA